MTGSTIAGPPLAAGPSAPVPRPVPLLPPPGGSAGPAWLPWLLVVVSGAVVLVAPDVPVLRVAAGFVLLVVPALTLARRMPWSFTTTAHAWVLAIGLSVLGFIVGGLLLNTVLPRVGVDRPLDERPVTIAVLLVELALLAWRPSVPLLVARTSPRQALRHLIGMQFRAVPTLAVGSVVLAVIGAVRLNNGAGGAVAVVAHLLAAATLAAALFARTDHLRRDVVAVYAAGLSLLLSTSLRSWFVAGHDVQREYISFQLTSGNGHWSMADYQNAYHACLSINILPTMIADLTGLSGAVIFKVVMQLLAAVLPVVVLLIARKALTPRLAVAAAVVFVAFPTFSSDMPFLVRQEVAFLFLALAVLMSTESGISVVRRRVLVVVLGIGVVLSHYSTTYLMIVTLAIALVVMWLTRWWERRRGRVDAAVVDGAKDDGSSGAAVPRPPVELAVLLHPLVLVALVAATWAWVSPATDSGGHLADTARESITNMFTGDGGPSSTDTSFSLLPGRSVTDAERLDLFAETAVKQRESRPDLDYVLPYYDGMLHPTSLELSAQPVTALGSGIDRVVPVDTFNKVLRGGAAFGLQALVLVGLGALLLRRRTSRRRGSGTTGEVDVSQQTRALMIGAFGAIAMVVVVPGLSAEYGVLRAFQQGLVLLAPVVVIGALTLFAPLKRWAAGAVHTLMIALVLVLTGVVSTVTGGYTGILALSDAGPYVQLHYVTDAEEAGYRWLGLNAGGRIVQAEVISDKLAANRLRYYPQGGVLVASDMYPATLLNGSVVFLGPDTVRDQMAAEFYTGTVVDYKFPTARVERHLDVVFSSPDAKILW